MDYRALSFTIFRDLSAMEKPRRAAHSLSVAALAQFLCGRFGIEPDKGYAAGLAHDLCKNLPKPMQWTFAKELPSGQFGHLAGIEAAMEKDAEFGNHIIHGPASAAFCMKHYNVEDEDFLESLAVHSTGKMEMSDLAEIIYIADKLEPGRITPTGTIGALSGMDLPNLMLFAVRAVVEWFGDRQLAVADATLVLYNELSKKAVKTT
jgi:nicotinate-nucleotide adenylyltransferase